MSTTQVTALLMLAIVPSSVAAIAGWAALARMRRRSRLDALLLGSAGAFRAETLAVLKQPDVGGCLIVLSIGGTLSMTYALHADQVEAMVDDLQAVPVDER